MLKVQQVAVAAAASDLAPRVDALLSFGLAGGLDPALRAGSIVVPAAVIEGAERWATDPGLHAALGGDDRVMLGGGAVLSSVAEKRATREATGAAAVDLESAAVARAAAQHGKAFAALRAICDPADQALPPAALAALDAQGRIGAVRILGSVLRQPGQIPALLALGRQAAAARRALLLRLRQTRWP